MYNKANFMIKKREKTYLTGDFVKNLDKLDTGDGLYIIAGAPLPNGEIRAKFFYSNEVPILELGTGNIIRKINISYSSVAEDNDKLLHFLFRKTRHNENIKNKRIR